MARILRTGRMVRVVLEDRGGDRQVRGSAVLTRVNLWWGRWTEPALQWHQQDNRVSF